MINNSAVLLKNHKAYSVKLSRNLSAALQSLRPQSLRLCVRSLILSPRA